MRFKRLLALLLAAALALAVLVGCGSGQQSAARVLLNLLDGKYPNISVELDPDLEADLRQAVNESETDAEIRAALEKLLGSGVSFRLIGDGQKGDSAWNLILYPGSDPDAAARSAYLEWDKIFSAFPSSGLYTAKLSMIETENGYAILVKATVDKAASRNDDDDDDDDDEPEPEKPKDPYTKNADGNYTVNTSNGLQELFNAEKDNITAITVIKLTADTEYTVDTTNGPLAETFKGELQGNGATVTITGGTQGLFNSIGDVDEKNGTVKDLTIQVNGTITGPANSYFGAVAKANYGTIQNCDVKGGTIQGGGLTGGIVGSNRGTIEDCSVEVKVEGSGSSTGGIAGSNKGTITACRSTGTVTIDNSNISNSSTGGVVGWNDGGTVTACYSTGDVTGKNSGGVVGYNDGGTVTACYHANGTVSGNNYIGGVVGYNDGGTVTACYWENNQEQGTGSGSTGGTTKVDGDWTEAVKAMNDACGGLYDTSGTGAPKLTWE